MTGGGGGGGGEKRSLLSIDATIAIIGVVMIMYIWFSTLTFILIPWAQATWSSWPAGWTVCLATLHVLLLLSLWSFIMATFTGPGEVPLNYRSFVMVPVPVRAPPAPLPPHPNAATHV